MDAGELQPHFSFPEHSLSKSGVKMVDSFTQKLPIKMGVDFRGRDAFMAKHFLDGAQVGTSLNQVRGKRVAEAMRRHRFFNPGFLNQIPNH